ncbi:MAG: nitroreductase family protein [Candidatus Omnitrophica bacterium]|nr:nitroreductase family protein [Candidatus Omnitrophota bacterium]
MKVKNLYNLILKRRTIRLFRQKKVSIKTIKKIINAARLAPSAGNLQFIEYLVIDKKPLTEKIFETLHWAAYIAPKRNPPLSQRPTFYIIILINKERTATPNLRDIGAAAENILLSLVSFKLGGCWLLNIDKEKLKNILKISDKFEIDSMIAGGYPDEAPILEVSEKNFKYWLDEKNILHVPKRPLKNIFHYNERV